MVHEPESANARKEVHYRKNFAESVPREALKKKTRRSASIRLSSAPIELHDDDDDAEHQGPPTLADFKREVTDRLGEIRYHETCESLQEDTMNKLFTFADYFAKKTRSKKPGMPLDVWVEGNTLPVAGVVDVDEFAKLVATNPHEVFKEVKLRSLMAIALAEQIKELHMTARSLDSNLELIHDWVLALRELRREDGAPLTDHEEELLATIEHKDKEIGCLQREAAQLNQAIADLVVQARQAHAGSTRDGREASVASQSSTTSNGKRSGKVPDPPVFYNEKDRDTDEFEQWHRDICNKLKVNADHFNDDQARQAYIESRLGGKAKRELAPYLRDTHPEPITTSDRLLTHLWEQYHDPLKSQKSLEAYDDLEMKPGDDYLAFKNDFVRLAGECGKPRASWKHEFNRRLSDSLQRALAGAFLDDTVTFDQFVRLGMQHAMINKRVSERRAANRQTNPAKPNQKASPRKTTTGGAATNTGKPNAGSFDRKLTQDKVRILYQEGRCFVCREKGHTSRDCPKKIQQDTVDREARLKALQAKWAPASNAGPNKTPDANQVRFDLPDSSEAEN
ncbi:hypothetical protein VTK56DRAFT_2410 [Thermocarpiscus australiensis]